MLDAPVGVPLVRVERIGDCTLYLGDCLEILPTLGTVDAVVTDPPYGTQVTSWDLTISAEAVAAIIGKARRYSVFFYSNTRLAHLLSAVRDCGHDAWVAVWHKPNAMGFERRFSPQWVPIVIAYKGTPPFWGKDLFSCPIVVQNVNHPTPKQLGITEWLVDKASPPAGGIVLDPFMGSGTTGVACGKLGRRFIGIEVDPDYFEIACERIRKAYDQPDFFVERPAPPTQEEMDL